MPLVGGHSFSNDKMDDVSVGWEDRLEVSDLGRTPSVLEGKEQMKNCFPYLSTPYKRLNAFFSMMRKCHSH